jgi:lysophospholipase L1-like esterase
MSSSATRGIVALVVVLAACACACGPTTPAIPTTTVPSNPIWITGDSIAGAAAIRLTTINSVAVGGAGFVNDGVGLIQDFTFLKMTTHQPTTLIVQGGTNDHFQDFDRTTEAMATFEADLIERNIAVIWLTTPVGTYQDLPDWLPRINNWIRSRDRVIDCDTDEIRAAGTVDGIHPTAKGYGLYAACIEAALVTPASDPAP